MAYTDFDKMKKLDLTSASGSPSFSRVMALRITSGDDSTTGTGEVIIDWSNVSNKADIAVYNSDGSALLDYYFELFDSTNQKAVIWVYNNWARDGSTQASIAYGNGPSDQSVSKEAVFGNESDIIAGYLFNESSGDLLDVTSNNNNGTVHGSPARQQDAVTGYSYELDESNPDYVRVSNDSTLDITTGKLTVQCWFLLHDVGKSFYAINQHASYAMHLTGTSGDPRRIEVYFGDGSDWTIIGAEGSRSLDFGVWYLGTTTYDNSTNILYYNGSEETSTSVNQNISNSDYDLSLGAAGDQESYEWDGKIAYTAIYDSTWSSDEIKAFYDASKSSPDLFSQQSATLATTSVILDHVDVTSHTEVTNESFLLRPLSIDDVQSETQITDSAFSSIRRQLSFSSVQAQTQITTVGVYATTIKHPDIQVSTQISPASIAFVKTLVPADLQAQTELSVPALVTERGSNYCNLPAFSVEAYDDSWPSSILGSAICELPFLEMQARYDAPIFETATAAVSLKAFTAAATGLVHVVGSGVLTLRALTATGTIVQGSAGHGDITLEPIIMDSGATPQYVGDAEIALSAISMLAHIYGDETEYPLLMYQEEGDNYVWQNS